MITHDGWHAESERCPSPNMDARPCGESISLLVVHNISLPPGQYGGGHVADFFSNRLALEKDPYFAEIGHLRVSAHLLIERTGKSIQFVSFANRAWHAGVSLFGGRTGCNDFSIGVELEGTDIEPYTDEQYLRLAAVTRELMATYPQISLQRIVGHADIAPGRKTDPGIAFDWYRYFSLLRQEN